MRSVGPVFLIVVVSLFIVLVDNFSFAKHVLEVYPYKSENMAFLLSLGALLYALYVVLITLFSSKYILKPLLMFLLVLSSVISYFMNSYNIVIDKTMIENVMETDTSESFDLLSFKLLLYVLFLGLIPAYLVYKTPVKYSGFKSALWKRVKLLLVHLALVGAILFGFSKFYTSFFREHKPLRLYPNPLAAIYKSISYTYDQFKHGDVPMKKIGLDAKQVKKNEKRKIFIMVVGEAARSDHFSLNGYKKETNPLLKKENIINYTNMFSCGTTTAVSVPCMFSPYDREDYDSSKGHNTYSALDVLAQAGVEVLWRDNNSDSKGVAIRVAHENYRSVELNTICDEECRDEGMLVGLKEVIKKSQKDIIIVLHQMGNHGPAYYKRYTDAFNKFKPVCQTNQLEECSKEEISNAYDNALLYTDYFLSKTINFLKQYDTNKNEVGMLYIADHGESLGDNGLYLHGLPYFIAPEHQKHVGALAWFGKNYEIDKERLGKERKKEFTQDYLFSTLLGLFEVKSEVYKETMDMFKP